MCHNSVDWVENTAHFQGPNALHRCFYIPQSQAIHCDVVAEPSELLPVNASSKRRIQWYMSLLQDVQ